MQQQQGGYRWLNGTVTKVALQDKAALFCIAPSGYHRTKEAEEKTGESKRLYFFLSQINQMLVKPPTDETTLFQQACDIAVDIGRFRMAWIGLLDPATLQLEPAAHAGNESVLSHINISAAADKPEGRGPSEQGLAPGVNILFAMILPTPQKWCPGRMQRCNAITAHR